MLKGTYKLLSLMFAHELVRIVAFFFFSSRRRHTRLVSDWSSDVCSSDLRRKCGPGQRGSDLSCGHFGIPPGIDGRPVYLRGKPPPLNGECGWLLKCSRPVLDRKSVV